MKTDLQVKDLLEKKVKELENLPYKQRKFADVIQAQICMCQWFLLDNPKEEEKKP